MMQLTYSEIELDVEECIPKTSMPEAGAAEAEMQPTLSAFDTLNYVYSAIAANAFIELEALR